jgi:hypothetical protein
MTSTEFRACETISELVWLVRQPNRPHTSAWSLVNESVKAAL